MDVPEPKLRQPNGRPTTSNPTVTVAPFGPAPLGVPSFVIQQFEIPPFLLPIYQACGTQYGIPWQVLASINKIETGFGTNLNVSSAGAVGWMQFMPATWDAYGTDANGDGRRDPYNPVDAICSAARYLKASGGDTDLRSAIFSYNNATWYVDEVLLYAEQYGKLPEDLVSSLTGLTQGARFPVAARVRYADDIAERQALERAKPNQGSSGNVADVVSSSPTRRGIDIFSRDGAPVVAVNDGTIKRVGHDKKLGNYLVLEDSYGNRFTYAQLGRVAKTYPVPKSDAQQQRLGKPNRTASRKEVDRRLYALPMRPNNRRRAALSGQLGQIMGADSTVSRYFGSTVHTKGHAMVMRPLRKGSHVVAGTVLGHIEKRGEVAPHLNFSIRPAGKGAPKIDPKPILDGWKLLEATAIYRAAGQNPFADSGESNVTQDLLMPKPQLERRVLADPRLAIYSCGQTDIRTGQIDQRILAAMEYLADKGFRLTITSLKCGHGVMTSSGYVSEHSTGDAMDIAMINGVPVTGHQGPGSLADSLIRALLELQGTMEPHQVISLEDLPGPVSFALPDHYDHVHVGYYPAGSSASPSKGKQFTSLLKPDQWKKLIGRIAEIDNPNVPTSPSKYALRDRSKKDRRYIGD
jgi:transglycosylase-like protein with SLT domain/peptidase M23-like protein